MPSARVEDRGVAEAGGRAVIVLSWRVLSQLAVDVRPQQIEMLLPGSQSDRLAKIVQRSLIITLRNTQLATVLERLPQFWI